MITRITAAKVTGFFHRAVTSSVTRFLEEAGVMEYYIMPSRSTMLQKRMGPMGLVLDDKIVDDPADRVICFVPPDSGQGVAQSMAVSGRLAIPGRGSVFVEQITISRGHDLCDPENNTCLSEHSFGTDAVQLRDGLTGICCIVQRGEGDTVARIALETGACVPLVTFGEGTGVRDKLGLLRITIPAEKEIVQFAATTYDAETVMDMIIDVAKLDEPGKGFIYLVPLEASLINMKVYRGIQQHAASVEQIVAAIDEMKGDSRWRTIVDEMDIRGTGARSYLRGLESLTYICDEGRGSDMTAIAMAAGAPGATISRLRYAGRRSFGDRGISPAREMSTMIVHPLQVEAIVDAMTAAGALDDRSHGLFFLSPVPRAYTYMGRR